MADRQRSSRMLGSVRIRKIVVDSILTYARVSHPNEGVLLLRGKVGKALVVVDDVVLPPFATQSRNRASFPLRMLPLDHSIVGTAHSHPSGVLQPSVQDLNLLYGRIMVIVAYPYDSECDLACFDRTGSRIEYQIFV